MAELARDSFKNALDLFDNYSDSKFDDIEVMEERLDYLEDQLDTFLIHLSGKDVSEDGNNEISKMLHAINDFERIGDHAINMAKLAKQIDDNNLEFSKNARKELTVLNNALREILTLTVEAFSKNDLTEAVKVEPLEQVIDDLTKEIRNHHIDRLQKGKCDSRLGVFLTDYITNCERASDHCSNIAVCLIQTHNSSFETHDYLNELKAGQEPAFVGQFGPKASPEKLTAAMKKLGFADVVEVAIGADLCSIEEAKDFMREVPEHQPFMATSCCPAWSVMAKKLFPTLAPYISMALTPMVLTARMLKKDDPDACIAFIGPCAAKKLEASRRTIRSDVDFVLTFEELMGMFNAKGVTFEDITDEEKVDLCEGTGDGRGFAVSGGVAKAVADVIHKLDPEREVKVVSAQGLKDCRKLLTLAKAGKYDGYLLEGMACPGGCVAGAGTLQAVEKSTALVNKYVKDAPLQNSLDSKYEINLDLITESHDDK